jgi:hypothetical protein
MTTTLRSRYLAATEATMSAVILYPALGSILGFVKGEAVP